MSTFKLIEKRARYTIFVLFGKLRTLNKDYIEFHRGFDCHSLAGRDGGKQKIVLASYCKEEHTLIHEVYFLDETR